MVPFHLLWRGNQALTDQNRQSHNRIYYFSDTYGFFGAATTIPGLRPVETLTGYGVDSAKCR
jgi:hypothetical protein